MIRINEILDKASAYLPPADIALVEKAYVFSASAHAGQVRLSGEPYLSHPLDVANTLAEMQLDAATIAAGLLHDTVEDTKVEVSEVGAQFGSDVAHIVDGVTKIGKMSFSTKEEVQAESIRKMIIAMAEDIRVILVKLADRLHNMRTLNFQKPMKQKIVSQETLDIYAPLANRLGLYRFKTELEDISLRYLKPDVYQQIYQGVQEHQTAGEAYTNKVIDLLRAMLEENGIKGRVNGRVKHIFSIYTKMQQQNLPLDQIYDLIAFRVVVSNIRECYSVLGLVHSIWKPVPGRFKDYLSMPKANMYQSLHTTVIGPDGERIEIQIRTEEMHRLAEYGVAAHWQYKGGGSVSVKDFSKFSWLRQILDWERDSKDPMEFMNSLRCDLFQEEVYVFTPNGEVKELPDQATPVDFAYLIHTEVGDHCAGAKVNGRLVPLNTALQNGDTVQIITDKSRSPSRDWLKFVKTAKARTRIKHWIRTEERARSIALAKEVLEKEGRKLGVNFAKALKRGDFESIARDLSYKSADDLFSAVGYAKLTPQQVLNRLTPPEEPQQKPQPVQRAETESRGAGTRSRSSAADTVPKPVEGVRIKGVEDMLVSFAGCCNPVPGDTIVGYISRGRGMTVHTADCPNVRQFEPERLLNVSWESEKEKSFPTQVKILAKNKRGVLAEIAALLARQDVNIDSGSFRSNVEGKSELIFTVEVHDAKQLYEAIEAIRSSDSVIEVGRMAPVEEKIRQRLQ